MGIPMDDNIHAPTVSSGPSSGGAPRDLAKLSMTDLMQEKEGIEEELSTLSSVLSSHGVNMNTTLTTFDGYPRDDIDIAQIRTIRTKIIRLRNDHKDAMTHLERKVHEQFTNLQRAQGSTTSDNANGTNGTRSDSNDTSLSNAGALGPAFARVNSVVPASPADQAGLKAGDTVRSFGTVNWINHERLTKVAEIVQQNEGRAVPVKVVRKDELGSSADLTLELTPRRDWGGRGLLGCHLVPL
ncbi:putative 26S proteasome non-ATPase regulatory subunit Nas2 [Aspergillus melleus]|uniref:putative 26S proteasome non-ATPase regulatory subunit Nas2 n=1 Tax=Aspergillus melleus TaxID=138277 RepID=UPI001E8CC87E|nr:putative 26S proteasome regulatory subunit [Aspergillus melleus]KAH8435291.1 putative 26S proteasome regulatory subunit [Aspergillus melleus]